MKKLMIAATIVCAAAFAQAATIKWSSNGMALTDANGTAISALDKGSLVLVSMATATDWANAVEIPTGSGSGQSTVTVSTRAQTLGQVTGTFGFTYTSGSGDNLVDNGDYLALMYKNEKGGLEQLVYTSGDDKDDPVAAAWKVEGLVNDGTSLTSKAIPMTGNFTTAAVPEPTSGLLLLLGIGAMALRRRRA